MSGALKDAGLKVTLPRLKILAIFEHSKERHLSAEDVYNQLLASGEEVGLATVYRVLTQFEKAGLVMRHNFTDEYAVFELDQGIHHDHLVCVKCGHVEEFTDSVIEQRQEAIAKEANYHMTYHALNIYGLCPQCQETAAQ